MASGCQAGLEIGFATLNYWQVTVLGVIQGITELLPISSSAHMRVVPALLGWQDPGSAFSAVMQLAALFAVISYFWQDVSRVVTDGVSACYKKQYQDPACRLGFSILLATLPIGLVGMSISHLLNQCESPLRTLTLIGFSSCAMSLLLALAEKWARPTLTLQQMGYKQALIVGIAQIGALIPGVSRSGSTLTAALFLNLKRAEAARFSFLLGIPAIALAGLKELVVLIHAHLPLAAWEILGVGLVVASISAFAAIWGLMHLLERYTTWPFVIYRALFGLYLLSISFF